MKKHIIWLAVLLTFLLFSLPAFAKPALPETPPAPPPQTAGEISVPSHTVPVISNIQVTENDITLDVSGSFIQISAAIDMATPSGFYQHFMPLTVTGGKASWSAADLPADVLAWKLLVFELNYDSIADISMEFRYDALGALENYRIRDDRARISYSFDSQGLLTTYTTRDVTAGYSKDGSLASYIFQQKGSSQMYNGQYELVEETFIETGTDNRIHLSYENGFVMRRIVIVGEGTQYVYDGQGILRESHGYTDETMMSYHLYDASGNLFAYSMQTEDTSTSTLYDAGGNLIRVYEMTDETQTMEEYEDGVPVRKTVTSRLLGGDYSIDVYENGVLTKHTVQSKAGESYYDAQGNYLGKTVSLEDRVEEYDAAGVMTGYTAYSRQLGGVSLTYNYRKVLQSLEYHDPYFSYIYRYDVKENAWYLHDMPYFGPIPFQVSELALDKEVEWYPNNTVCSFGPQFRDVNPGLTDKWYMFTPIDLSSDGTQTFELVGGSVYVLGQVSVTVAGDSVTVHYATVLGKHGNIYTKSEYLNFFPDLASVTTVNPDELGAGFKFGQTISISKDLGGDTNVLMFVRNVATFCSYADKNTLLRRYFKNLPSRVEKRNAMLDLMD